MIYGFEILHFHLLTPLWRENDPFLRLIFYRLIRRNWYAIFIRSHLGCELEEIFREFEFSLASSITISSSDTSRLRNFGSLFPSQKFSRCALLAAKYPYIPFIFNFLYIQKLFFSKSWQLFQKLHMSVINIIFKLHFFTSLVFP